LVEVHGAVALYNSKYITLRETLGQDLKNFAGARAPRQHFVAAPSGELAIRHAVCKHVPEAQVSIGSHIDLQPNTAETTSKYS
jgi:hypothetical protein